MLLLIGHNNYVRSELVAAIIEPNSSPIRRLKKSADERDVLIDATSGHKTKSLLVLTTGQVMLSSLQPDTLRIRLNNLYKVSKTGAVMMLP